MRVLLQRVTSAEVRVSGRVVGAIDSGLLAFVGMERGDDDASVERMAGRIAGYRMFADEQGRMNRSVRDVGGSVLLVSQFTLAADTGKGLRPSFSRAAEPQEARRLCDALAAGLRDSGLPVAEGKFGADMQVSLVNDGPVTFLINL